MLPSVYPIRVPWEDAQAAEFTASSSGDSATAPDVGGPFQLSPLLE